MEQNNKNSLNDMLETASKKLGTDSEKAKEISSILSDKNKASKILSSPKAKQLLQKFFGGK